jgi:hypothetical protein
MHVEPQPRLLNFGSVGVQEKETRPLILHNHTASSVMGVASPGSAPFTLAPPGPFTIPAKKTMTFMITFAPTAQGQQNATASFAPLSDSAEPALMVPLTGDGVPGTLAIQNRVVDFGKNPKSSKLMRMDRLSNNGKGVLTINIPQLAPPFSVSPTGSKMIPPHMPLTLTIQYSGGQSSQPLKITTDNPKQPSETITVKGESSSNFPTPTPSPIFTLPATPTATATGAMGASPTATSILPSGIPSTAGRSRTSSMLFAGHGLANTMTGPSIDGQSQKAASAARVYDPNKDVFRSAGKMNSPRVGASSTTLPDGKVLIAGGASCVESKDKTRSCTPTNTAQLFDPKTHKFSTAGSGSNAGMNVARMAHTATLISGCNCPLDGDVLIAGGNSGVESVSPTGASAAAAPLQSAELYDYRSNSFIAIPSQTISPREEAIASAIPADGGKILIAGGDSKGIFQSSIADAEIFDPVTESFASTAPMSSPREFARASALNPDVVNGSSAGDILVTGGFDAVGNMAGSSLNSAELYDPVAGTWKPVSSMASARALHSMTLLTSGPDKGKVLVAGGATMQGSGGLKNLIRNSLASAELFNPADSSFDKTGSMKEARSAHSAIVIDNGPKVGDVLVAGGQNCTGAGCDAVATIAELYDPATGKWNPSKAMLSHSLGAVLGEVVPVP